MWYNGSGRLIYDPKRPGMKTRTEWWAVVNIDDEIARYYRWWVEQNSQVFGLTKIKLYQPSWGAHISVIRGEKPQDDLMYLWKKYHGEWINFRYSGFVKQSGNSTGSNRPNHYFFVEVDSPRLVEIRQELNRPTDWKFHITIGRTY